MPTGFADTLVFLTCRKSWIICVYFTILSMCSVYWNRYHVIRT